MYTEYVRAFTDVEWEVGGVVTLTDEQLEETIHVLETRPVHVDSLEWMCLFALRELKELRKRNPSGVAMGYVVSENIKLATRLAAAETCIEAVRNGYDCVGHYSMCHEALEAYDKLVKNENNKG